MPTPAAEAISFSEVATPPRVGSRSTWISLVTSSMAATSPLRGWQSLSISVPNCSPSRTLITATPWTPMSPLTITTSPGRARSGRMSTLAGTTPIPAVLMYTPSPWPDSTTLVSPVTTCTPARAAASPSRWATAPTFATSVPSSRMKAAERNSAWAPLIARSLTVPLTARSPMLPPGKNSGRTTNESVENASRCSPTGSTAESPSWARVLFAKAGRNTCSTSSADMAPPPPWPITIVGLSRSGRGHVQPSKLAGLSVRVSDSANGAHLPRGDRR